MASLWRSHLNSKQTSVRDTLTTETAVSPGPRFPLHGGVEQPLEEISPQSQTRQAQLIQLEKLAAFGRFSAGIVHELKNSLGVVLGGLEFLERKFSNRDGEIQTALQMVRESTLRTEVMLRGLLQFGRPSSDKLERVQPDDLIIDTLALLKYRVPLGKITIKPHLFEEELWIEVDKNQIQQVLFNILANAMEAMPHGGTLKVGVHKEEVALEGVPPLSSCCVIGVTDTGEGISPENLARLFEPFFTTKGEDKGTGLGLSVSKAIVESHQGRLFIESELGRGTTVKIVLPLVKRGGEGDEKDSID